MHLWVISSYVVYVVSAFGGFYGAYTCAGTAFDAFFGINLVLPVLVNGNGTHRAFRFAGAATYTKVFVNYICHGYSFLSVSRKNYFFVLNIIAHPIGIFKCNLLHFCLI